MSLYDRWNRQLVEPALNFEEIESFTVDAGDSLDVQQFLKRLDGAEIDLWKGERDLDPYGDEVKELGRTVETRTREFLVKAGDIPLGVAELTFSSPQGSLNRSVPVEFNWKNKSFRNIQSRVTDMVENSERKIPESLARYSGISQVRAGGKFEVDRDIDDFDDALRAFRANTVTFTSQSSSEPLPNSKTKQVKNGLKNNKDAFLGAALGITGLTGVAYYLVKSY